VPAGHYDLERVWLALACILAGKVPLQAVPRPLGVFDSCYRLGTPTAVPDWATSRMWLLRLGLARLRQDVVVADDWVWLLDHSVQSGRQRRLAVLGGRLRELPPGPRRRSDLRLLHLKIMTDPSWYRVAARAEQAVRNRGRYRGVDEDVRQRLRPVVADESGKGLAAELVAFVAEQSQGSRPGEKVPGSTEVPESCFGPLKALAKDQSRSGFTGLVLGPGALPGRVAKEVVRQAQASTPIKAVRQWCAENIGASLQSKRGQIYRLAGVTDLG
jgi:hypothetical protein